MTETKTRATETVDGSSAPGAERRNFLEASGGLLAALLAGAGTAACGADPEEVTQVELEDHRADEQTARATMLMRVPIDRVAALIEDVRRVTEWNPLLREVQVGEEFIFEVGSTVDWDADLGGIGAQGRMEILTFNRPRLDRAGRMPLARREYAFRSAATGVVPAVTTRFTLVPNGRGATAVTAALSFTIPAGARSFVTPAGSQAFFDASVRQALDNVARLVRHS